ncbi:MAG: Ribonuclease E [Deltaproteobacteria bacterium ADurb.Bin510]|nr:MAG: Ribonuclease E [Deltaproteobacteria bacterium ADurb.Bin510]
MKKMLVNARNAAEVRVAIVTDTKLSGLYVEGDGREAAKGDIYKGQIVRYEPSLNAYFVAIGQDKNGFLPVHDLNPGYLPEGCDLKNSQLERGLNLPVQVVREEKGRKGALLTMNLSIPGRYLVLMPKQPSLKGISRKIEESGQRKQLKATLAELDLPDNMGLIVRTAGMDRTKTELAKDLSYLLKLYDQFVLNYRSVEAPAQIFRDSDVVIRALRDYYTPDIDDILVDDAATAARIEDFIRNIGFSRRRGLVKLVSEAKPLFSKYELERQIEAIFEREAPLPSGGYLVIEQTEALVSIDVNSGQATSGSDIMATALATNLEAAREIARQLVLRDLGGLVVIDFIDMHSRENVRAVEKALKEALKPDRAHIVLGRISDFGLLELSRERLAPPLIERSHIACPTCAGRGLVPSPEYGAARAIRAMQVSLAKAKEGAGQLNLAAHPELAMELLNRRRSDLTRLEQDYGISIAIRLDHTQAPGEFKITNIL